MRVRFSLLLFFTAVIFLFRPIHAQNAGATTGSRREHNHLNSQPRFKEPFMIPMGAPFRTPASLYSTHWRRWRERRSDAKGEYRFEGLRSGTFTVVAYLTGFSNLSAEVNLTSGETRTIDLHLKLSAVQEQVIVSASLGGALAPQIGSSVSVVSHDEIENRDSQTVYDSLRETSGRRNQPDRAARRRDQRVYSRRKFELQPGDDRRNSVERFRRRLRFWADSSQRSGSYRSDARAGKRALRFQRRGRSDQYCEHARRRRAAFRFSGRGRKPGNLANRHGRSGTESRIQLGLQFVAAGYATER